MKQVIRLTESDLHNLVKESVKQIIREMKFGTPRARSFLRQAMGNKVRKYNHESDPALRNKYWKQIHDVSSYAHNTGDKKAKEMSLPHPWYYIDGIQGAGNAGLNHNRYYNGYQTANWEDIAKEMFGKEVADKFYEWADGEEFDPTWYLNMYGEDWSDAESDVDADDAFEFELDKLDSCPFLTPEQIQAYKQRLKDEIEGSEIEYNDSYDPPDPPEPPYEYGMRYYD